MSPVSVATAEAEQVHRLLRASGQTVATAESLTGGLLAAALTDRGGASSIFRGGLVVYATDLKATVAGVPQPVLDAHGPVSPQTAMALATGARERLGATYGLSTTGVAGPERQDGIDVGTVYLGLAGPGQAPVARRLTLAGDREEIRRNTVVTALQWLGSTLERLGESVSDGESVT